MVVSTRCKDGDEQVTDTCKEMNPDDTAKFFLDIKVYFFNKFFVLSGHYIAS